MYFLPSRFVLRHYRSNCYLWYMPRGKVLLVCIFKLYDMFSGLLCIVSIIAELYQLSGGLFPGLDGGFFFLHILPLGFLLCNYRP